MSIIIAAAFKGMVNSVALAYIECEPHSACMLLLGGLGHAPSLKIYSPENESEAVLTEM